jgi:UDP-N-acetylmuramoyl-L-alanyl-D-glutamate--2,6-diaminopimelate ligase
MASIASGMDGRGADLIVEPDRREAIRRAMDCAAPADLVLIAGKGHENTQDIDGIQHPFDDRDVARRALGGLAQRRAARVGRSTLSASGIA